jgi:DNA-binding response OmpR family regulator
MVVDDDQGILEALEIVVSEIGYTVIPVGDAQHVIKEAEKHKPELILLDLLLSGIDGRDVTKSLKLNKLTKSIPVILMSADARVQEKSLEAGADGYLKKPFDLDMLEKLIIQFTE